MADSTPDICPHCGGGLGARQGAPLGTINIVKGHIPSPEEIKFSIGPYHIIDTIGKGGMGEVFVAYDSLCGRKIALKKIREDLLEHTQLQNRFLKEAHITSQLTHPAIIPIYTIHREKNLIYYTMPFVEGETLKEMIKRGRREEKKEHRASGGHAIPALMRIFLTICHAVAYAHSKNILHRDLKPENIIIGQYGEVLILDWGLAKLVQDRDEEEPQGEEKAPFHMFHGLTRLGKVVGTVAYMAPERALGSSATFQTDIYSLGVILYQLLTLRPPFRRGTLSKFRATVQTEKLTDPAEIAPYRDVPRPLARIAEKCLALDLGERYGAVEELIHDLQNFLEGRSEWFQIAELDISRGEDWEFRGNFFINEHMAITRGHDLSEWVSLMISKSSFNSNTMLVTKVKCGEKSQGLGLMLCIPEAAERRHVNDGYCLWLGSDLAPTTKLLRSTVEMISRPDITLQRHRWYTVKIQKMDNNVHVYLDDILQFSYISHIPLAGTHVGLLSRDADFELKSIHIYISSLNLTVNCLAIPDAFLAHKQYDAALNEYRRIAYSFPGRAEGREALFRAGVTLLEEARNASKKNDAERLYDLALQEFTKHKNTTGAPLEYVGKGLVYQSRSDYSEETKCYELAFRRYPKHPLLPILYEQIVYRMYETSKHHRKAAYQFILLTIRFLPKSSLTDNVRRLFHSLQKHWEPLDFIHKDPGGETSQKLSDQHFSIQVAFWLSRRDIIVEIIEELLDENAPSAITLANGLYSLLELGAIETAAKMLALIEETLAETEIFEEGAAIYNAVAMAIRWHAMPLDKAMTMCEEYLKSIDELGAEEERLVYHLMRLALKIRGPDVITTFTKMLTTKKLSYDQTLKIDYYRIWALLLAKRWHDAGLLLHSYPLELLSQENSMLHFLYGCWLLVTEGREIADVHFAGLIELPYPRSWMLIAYNLSGKIGIDHSWYQKAFTWEKMQLLQQLSLFNHCSGDDEKAAQYHAMELELYEEAAG